MVGQVTRTALVFLLALAVYPTAHAQVFTVGEKTATADIKTDFTPTRVELSDQGMTERGRRELFRDLDAEQGFAHRVLPLGTSVTLHANGVLAPGGEEYKKLVYNKGQSAAPGDRIAITALSVKGDAIVIDLNGGPYPPHRFMRHIQIGVGGATSAQPNLNEQASGCRVVLLFEGGVPEISAPEVKALLAPLVDFRVKTGELAYAETLPTPIKGAIASHEILVGMNHRMVLAAMGAPENKVRESNEQGNYEEWIYGHQPQTVQFVRFVGDRVSLIKVAALGKPIQVRDQDEMAGYRQPLPTRAVNITDAPLPDTKAQPPSLRQPGDEPPAVASNNSQRKVQYPVEKPGPKPSETSSDAKAEDVKPVVLTPQP